MALAILKKRLWLVALIVLLGLLSGWLIARFNPVYSSRLTLGTDRSEPEILRLPEAINRALTSIFSQASFSQLFASVLFKELEEQSKSGPHQASAATALKYFYDNTDLDVSDEKTTPRERAVLSLAAKLGPSVVQNRREPGAAQVSNDFSLVISASDSNSWTFDLKAEEKNFGPAMFPAVAKAFNAAIQAYKESEKLAVETVHKTKIQDAKTNIADALHTLSQTEAALGMERTKLSIEFYQIENEVQQFAKIAGADIAHRPSTATVANQRLLLKAADGTDPTSLFDYLELSRLQKRAATLAESPKVSRIAVDDLLARMNDFEIRKSRVKARIDASKHSLEASISNLTTTVADIAASTYLPPTYVLPYAVYDPSLAATQARSAFDQAQTQRLTLFSAIGAIVGIFFVVVWFVCLQIYFWYESVSR